MMLEPLNVGAEQRLEISSNEIYGPHKMDGFTATRRDLLRGKFGIWAKFLATVFGVGAHANVSYERDDDTVYKFDYLETTFFNPSKDYLRSSMTVPVVRAYMRAAKFALPVYMVTGIKVGRGVAVQSSHEVGGGVNVAVGIGHPGAPAAGGPEMELTSKTARGFAFTRGDDCLVALRLKKITYKSRIVKYKTETRGATMQDGSGTVEEDEVPELELGDGAAGDVTLDDFDDEMKMADGTAFDDEGESIWIVPASEEETS